MAKSRIEVDRKEFLSLLKNGSVFCGKVKGMSLINDNVSFATRAGKIRIESTDNENTIRMYGKCYVLDGEDVSFCASPRDMVSVLSLIGDDTITMDVDTEDKKQVTIMHSHGKSKLPCLSAEDFPALPKPAGDSVSLTFDATILQRWMSVGLEFVDTGMLRPALTGILLKSENGTVFCAASDGHKLFTSELQMPGVPDFNVIVSSRSAVAVAKMPHVGVINMSVSGNMVTFSGANATLVSRVIEGKFPNVSAVIPKCTSCVLTCNREEMLDSVRRLMPMADSASCLIVIHPYDGTIRLASENISFNKSAEEKLPFVGDDMCAFGLKGSILISVLSTFNDEQCVIKKDNNSSRPALIERTDADGGHDTYLIMPMNIEG